MNVFKLLIFQCHRGRSLDAFFDAIESEVQFISIVGCGCSPATEPVAEISHQWNISQVHTILYCSLVASEITSTQLQFSIKPVFHSTACRFHLLLDRAA